MLTNQLTGVTTNIYCSYGVNRTSAPYTMATKFRCEHDLILADIAAQAGEIGRDRPRSAEITRLHLITLPSARSTPSTRRETC